MSQTMPESATPARYEIDRTSTITDGFLELLVRDPGAQAFSVLDEDAQTPVTREQFYSQVTDVAKGLMAQGVKPGTRVGVFGPTSYLWTVVDYAVWFAGGVSVPFYDTASAEQMDWMIQDAAPSLLLVASDAHRELLAAVDTSAGLPVIVWEGAGYDELVATGTTVTDGQLERQRAAVRALDPATIIYTSGTTGKSRGCVLTHANFVQTVQAAAVQMPQVIGGGSRCLLFIPTAHVFARFIQVMCVNSGVVLAHQHDLSKLTDALGVFKPTFILGVPRVFEKVFNSALANAEAQGRGGIFRLAEATAVAYQRAKTTGRPSARLRLQYRLFDKLVYSKLRAVLGGNARYAISGGGPLGEHLGLFFRGIGVDVLEGYGLTETTAPITVNPPGRSKIGTVGVPLPGCAVAIAPDGEVLAKGAPVFREYLGNPSATATTFHDGWLATGDLGSLDADGYLSITGRKKELIVTSSGKNVAPAPLEDVIRRHPIIGQPVVAGDNRKFVSALIFLDSEMLPTWLKNHGLPGMDLATASGNDDVRAAVQGAIDRANATVSRAESVRAFRIVPVELTEENGYLSAKQSVKRHLVLKDFADELDELYATAVPPA